MNVFKLKGFDDRIDYCGVNTMALVYGKGVFGFFFLFSLVAW